MRYTRVLLILAVAAGAGVPVPGAAAASGDDVPLVVHVRDTADAAPVAAAVGGALGRRVLAGTYQLRVPAGRSVAALSRLRADRRVAWAEPDYPVRLAVVPDDPCFDLPSPSVCFGVEQWGMRKVGAPSAWDTTKGSSSVTVAVLDTGVQSNHPDLAGKVVVGGNYSSSSSPNDLHGHGTHVAGVVAAATNNARGVAGLGWNTKVRAVKVLNDQGVGSHSAVAAGITEAVNVGARVVSLSLVDTNDSNTLRQAVQAARDAGVLVVAAAGNSGSTTPNYPAAYAGVVSVAATDRNDNLAPFSNRGSWVSIAAPGVEIVSTCSTISSANNECDPSSNTSSGYAVFSGTSMATPHVSGAAALLFTAFPGSTADQVRARLGAGAAQIRGTGTNFEWGRLDVPAAMRSREPGYWLVAADGGLFSFGSAQYYGSGAERPLLRPVVGMAASPTRRGYWQVTSDGAVLNYGDAGHHGSMAGIRLNGTILAMEPHPSGAGYWLVGSDGGIFSFGDAEFHGSTGNIQLNQPIVGLATTPTGAGYWLVARDGGIFSFGDARFHGSTGAIRLNQPVVGMATTPSGNGYWLVAADGGIFAFGDARFQGSTGAIRLNQPIVGMRPTPTGNGYWLVARDGGIFAFGDARFLGSTGGTPLNQPVVGMAA